MWLSTGQEGMDGSDINHSYIWTLAIYHAVLHPFFPFFNNLGGHMFRLYQKMMKIRISGSSEGGEPPLIHIWIHFGGTKPLSFRGCFCNNLEYSITIIYLIQFLFHFPISPQNISQMGKPGLSDACGLAKLTQLVNEAASPWSSLHQNYSVSGVLSVHFLLFVM